MRQERLYPFPSAFANLPSLLTSTRCMHDDLLETLCYVPAPL